MDGLRRRPEPVTGSERLSVWALSTPISTEPNAHHAEVVMSDWEIRRNPDGTIDEIVAHGVDLHLEQTDKNAWSFNVYTNQQPSQGDDRAPFLQGDIYSKKKVTVFVEEGQDVYPKPVESNIDKATPPSM